MNNKFTQNMDHNALALLAAVQLQKASTEGGSRRLAVNRATLALMEQAGISQPRAEALVWRAQAEVESRPLTADHYINLNESTRDLLVINAAGEKLVLTLAELVQFHRAASSAPSAKRTASRFLPRFLH